MQKKNVSKIKNEKAYSKKAQRNPKNQFLKCCKELHKIINELMETEHLLIYLFKYHFLSVRFAQASVFVKP